MKVLILADDLTGALDTTCKFGRNSIVLLSGEGDADFVGITTDSRLLKHEEAVSRVRETLLKFPSWQYLYKKADSTMRGKVGAELGEICRLLNAKVPFTPAYPEQGRIVVDGRLYVRGKRLEETPYVSELPIRSSSILEILRATTSLRVGYWGGDHDIITFRNVRSRRDLSEAIEQILENGFKVMGGSAGLAMELSRILGCERSEEIIAKGPILFLSGSENEVTKRQFSLLAKEVPVVGHSDEEIKLVGEMLKSGKDVAISFNLREVLKDIARIAEVIVESKPGALVVVGGETLRVLLKHLEASAIRVGDCPEEGVAAGWILGGPLDGTPLVSKAGGFGNPRTLLRILNFLRTRR
ncbi:MAG: four-carbon acid sugar kinase family protein [Candidatus Korarchaeum sp.]